jgi:Tol biopolymer transport system component
VSAAFESFHLFQNRPGTSASGLIAVTAKRGGRDALYLIDPATDRILRRLDFPELVALHDPALAPDGNSVVFAAQGYDGQQDLYRASWPGETTLLERLTHDAYDDIEPALSPDGKWLAWASDRGDLAGRYSLWRMSMSGGPPEALSHPAAGDDRQPAWSPDGNWIAYRSTRGGTSDLWVRPAVPSFEARRATRLRGVATDPDWLPRGDGLLFTVQEGVTFHTWSVKVNPDSLTSESEAEPRRSSPLPAVADASPARPYERRLGFDLVQNGVTFDPGFGGGGAGQIALSDMLGNEQILLSLANDSEQFGNFWDGWEGGVTYLNQSRRMYYGIGVFRLTRLYDPDFDVVRREKRVGLLGLVSYPFSPFTRIEASVQVRHATNHLLRSGSAPTVDLVSNFVSFVHDDSRWWWDGPTGGSRLNLTAGFTRDMSSGLADYATLLAEIRHYRQPIRHVILATRAQVSQSFGNDAQRAFLGGPGRLRINQRQVISGLRVANAQVEARFPLLRNLVLSAPAPWQLPTLHGALFVDGAWARGQENLQRVADGGFALYLGGGLYPELRWNWVWRSDDFRKLTSPQPATYFTLDFTF